MAPLRSIVVSVIALGTLMIVCMGLACNDPAEPPKVSSPKPYPTPTMTNKPQTNTGPISGNAAQTAESTPFSDSKPSPANSQTDEIRDMNPLNRLPIKPTNTAVPPGHDAPVPKRRRTKRNPTR